MTLSIGAGVPAGSPGDLEIQGESGNSPGEQAGAAPSDCRQDCSLTVQWHLA